VNGKIGLDLHGTIDHCPDFFSILSELFVSNGGEVHIITGSRETDEVHEELKELGIVYTDFFSITDQLLFEGLEHTINEDGTYNFDSDKWDAVKGAYASLVELDFHIDDTAIYGDYFKTPFFLYPHLIKTN